jgi:hypothetical protein
MNLIKAFLTKLLLKKEITITRTMLGRWKIDYCNVKINRKIDLSNEDHCGPCSQYTLKKK